MSLKRVMSEMASNCFKATVVTVSIQKYMYFHLPLNGIFSVLVEILRLIVLINVGFLRYRNILRNNVEK